MKQKNKIGLALCKQLSAEFQVTSAAGSPKPLEIFSLGTSSHKQDLAMIEPLMCNGSFKFKQTDDTSVPAL